MASKITALIEKASKGDRDAANQLASIFWEASRLKAKKYVGRQLQSSTGASDIANAALRSLLTYLEKRHSQVRSRTHFESELTKFIKRKAASVARKEQAAKRDNKRKVSVDDHPAVSREDAPDLKATLSDLGGRATELIVENYEGKKQQVGLLRLVGKLTVPEIMDVLKRDYPKSKALSQRTIEVYLQAIEKSLAKRLFGEQDDG